MSTMEPSGLLKLTELGVNMQHPICDACETVAHCTNHGCVPIQPVSEGRALKLAMARANDLRLEQLRAAEGHYEDKGYMLGNQADYEAFVAKRNQFTGPSGPPPLTYEEMLHELWYLRRRVRQLEQQISNQSLEQ